MAKILLTPEAQLRNKVEHGLAHCVDVHFMCKGCPYEELESSQFPLRCIYTLLSDIQRVRYGDFEAMEIASRIES